MGQSLLFDVATFFIHAVAQDFGCAFVAVAHFFEYILQGGQAGLGEQPRLQERMRSPEVAAVKAPAVNASRAARSGVLFSGWVTVTAQYLNIPTLSLRL